MKIDSVQDVRWSTRAEIPEDVIPPIFTPSISNLAKVRGRSGDLLVLRLNNSHKLSPDKLRSLRSLNLREPGSAALCLSHLPNTWGMIESVKDHVAVIEIGYIIHLERTPTERYGGIGSKSRVEYERLQYGTSSKPGELVRSDRGSFFAFESDRSRVRTMWSSSEDLRSSFAAFQESFRSPPVELGTTNATIVVGLDSKPEEIIETSVSHAVDMITNQSQHILMARLAFRLFEFTWEFPHRPFDDIDAISSEIGVNSSVYDIDLDSTRRFAYLTGDTDLLKNGGCRVSVRQHGNLKTFDL